MVEQIDIITADGRFKTGDFVTTIWRFAYGYYPDMVKNDKKTGRITDIIKNGSIAIVHGQEWSSYGLEAATQFEVGDRIIHNHFGTGTVYEIVEVPDEKRTKTAKVRFDSGATCIPQEEDFKKI
jgi:hypothetical protein